jgi:hypothetical protein
MDLTIIIVNWNGGELLLRCLRSIRASRTSFQVKVIVVDNDSRDGSREAAQREFPEFKISNSGANLGFGRANNLARTLTDTPLVLFLNPDTELKPDTLEKCVQCLREKPDVGALGCKMRSPDRAVQEQGVQWHLTPWRVFLELVLVTRDRHGRLPGWVPTHDPNQSGYVCKLYGGFVLARRAVLDRAGWFDERYFMYAEDADLSRTIQALGWKLYYTAEAEIIHVAGGTSEKAPSGFSVLMKHESIGKLMRKYHGRFGALAYRMAILSAAGLRLIVLQTQRVVSKLRGDCQSSHAQGAVFKHILMARWALGLKRAVVVGVARPGQPPPQPHHVSTGSASAVLCL